ncbi:DUF6059 family protein [Streptomyces sp. NPDC046197]|uniref:DUF6059 family protein n=1 Tax=Streptomyces sp. NPDC046197 TaxID=3154337 RepID=UPI0033D48B57
MTIVYRFLADCLVAHGWTWIGPAWPLHRPHPRLDGPPPGHPERLRPDIPLSGVEAFVERELAG